MAVNKCDSQITLHRQEIDSPKWLILCVMMHVMIIQFRLKQQTWLLKSELF